MTFRLGAGTGTETCSGATDSSGTAQWTLVPAEAAGSYTLTATFPGDASFLASSTSEPAGQARMRSAAGLRPARSRGSPAL